MTLNLGELERRIDIVENSPNENKNCIGTAFYLRSLQDSDLVIPHYSLKKFRDNFPKLIRLDEPKNGALIVMTLEGDFLREYLAKILGGIPEGMDINLEQIAHIGVMIDHNKHGFLMACREELNGEFKYFCRNVIEDCYNDFNIEGYYL